MTYDIFNNMLTYGSDKYTYDDANQRLRKIEGSDTTFYIRNGLSTLAEYDGSGDLLGEYIHDDRGLIAKFDSTEGHFWYITDHLGSTRRLESSSMQRDYYPFGEDYTAAGSETDYQFTGKELDSGSGLYYYIGRYYDRRVGRFLTVDAEADHPLQIDKSPYAYAWNNPVRLRDPDGRIPLDTIWDLGNVVADIGRGIYHEIKGNRQAANQAWMDLALDGAALRYSLRACRSVEAEACG